MASLLKSRPENPYPGDRSSLAREFDKILSLPGRRRNVREVKHRFKTYLKGQQVRARARLKGPREEIRAHFVEKTGSNKKQAKATLESLTELIVRQLKKEGSLRIAGLGIFRKRKTKARVGRNPVTGEQVKIPVRTRLQFTPAKSLKDAVLG